MAEKTPDTLTQVIVPKGYKLVPDTDPAVDESVARHEMWKEYFDKPAQQRSQEAANKKFPEGKLRFKVTLIQKQADGKPFGFQPFPELMIKADYQSDAIGRYREVCGITECNSTFLTAVPA